MDIVTNRRQRLRELIASRYDGKQVRMFDATGIGTNIISDLLRVKPFGEKLARRIEEKAGLPAGWLDWSSDEEPAPPRQVAEHGAEYVTIPEGPDDDDEWADVAFYPTAAAAAGHGAVNGHDAPRLRLKFRRVSLKQKGLDAETLAVTNVRGESMSPLLEDGDQVMIDTSQRAIRDGDIYVCRVDGEAEVVKRLYRRPGGRVLVRSENPAHPEYEAELGPGFEVLGRAMWRAGWL